MKESQSFSMHSSFPKREYTSNDMTLTLRELQLAPTATLLIIPVIMRLVFDVQSTIVYTLEILNFR